MAALSFCPDSIYIPATTYTFLEPAISTHCPVCDFAKSAGLIYTTIYKTTYVNICPTGLTYNVYTVTNECTGTTPVNTKTLPQGFTTTIGVCTGCYGSPTLTITIPITDLQVSDAITTLALTPVEEEATSKVSPELTTTMPLMGISTSDTTLPLNTDNGTHSTVSSTSLITVVVTSQIKSPGGSVTASGKANTAAYSKIRTSNSVLIFYVFTALSLFWA